MYSIVCLTPVYNGKKYIQRFLKENSPQVDGIVFLNDGSTDDTFENLVHPKIIDVIHKERINDDFDDLTNRQILLKYAQNLDTRWIIWLDIDEVLHDFEDGYQLIDFLDNDIEEYRIPYISLWNDEKFYNKEYPGTFLGEYARPKIFKKKTKMFINTSRKLHFIPYPYLSKTASIAPILLKHLCNLTEQDRENRREKYRISDPDCKYEDSYDYMLENNPICGEVRSVVNKVKEHRIKSSTEHDTKNILFILPNLFNGGLEGRVADEIKAFKKNKYNVFLIVNKGASETAVIMRYNFLSNIVLLDYSTFEVNSLINCIAYIKKICKKWDIETIYTHDYSNTALPGSIVAQSLKLPIITTLHSPISAYTTPLWNFIFSNVLSKSFTKIVGMSKNTEISFKHSIPQVTSIPNLVDTDKFVIKNNETPSESWLIVSRLSPEKIAGIASCIEFAYKAGIVRVAIAGEGVGKMQLINLLNEADIVDYVDFLKDQYDISNLIHRYSGVFGVDRVILEAMASGKPACIIGYSNNIKGFVTPNNFTECSDYNFSGSNLQDIDLDEFQNQLQYVQKIDYKKLRNMVLKKYSTDLWHHYIQNVYEEELVFKENTMLESISNFLFFFGNTINHPFYKQNNFIAFLEELIYSTEHYNENLARQFELAKQRNREGFEYKNPYKHHGSSAFISIDEPVESGRTILNFQQLSLDLDDNMETYSIKPYLISKGSYKIIIDFLITSNIPPSNDFPILFSFKFNKRDFKENKSTPVISDINDINLPFSSIENIGHFHYISNSKMFLENPRYETISFQVPSHIELSEFKVMSWKVEKNEIIEIQDLSIISI